MYKESMSWIKNSIAVGEQNLRDDDMSQMTCLLMVFIKAASPVVSIQQFPIKKNNPFIKKKITEKEAESASLEISH